MCSRVRLNKLSPSLLKSVQQFNEATTHCANITLSYTYIYINISNIMLTSTTHMVPCTRTRPSNIQCIAAVLPCCVLLASGLHAPVYSDPRTNTHMFNNASCYMLQHNPSSSIAYSGVHACGKWSGRRVLFALTERKSLLHYKIERVPVT